MKKGNIRFFTSMTLINCVSKPGRLLGRKSAFLPGWILNGFCPDLLEYIEKPDQLVYIMGTNGKTAISELSGKILEERGIAFAANTTGSNEREGFISTFLEHSSFYGKAREKIMLIEVDEVNALSVMPLMPPDILVCSGLTSDHDAQCESTERVIDQLNRVIPDHTTLILNGDDPILSRLKPDNKRKYYSASKFVIETDCCGDIYNIAEICPVCHEKMVYDSRKFEFFGQMHCNACGYKTAEADYELISMDEDHAKILMKTPEGEYSFPQIDRDPWQTYLELASIALMNALGLKNQDVKEALEKIEPVRKPYQIRLAGNQEIVMYSLTSQSPFLNSRAFEWIASEGKKCSVLLLNDASESKIYDSANISWCYETKYEYLNTDCVYQIIAAGRRCYDQKMRLLLAGVAEDKITCVLNTEDSVKLAKLQDVDRLYILYTRSMKDKAVEIYEHVIKRLDRGTKR